MLFPIYTTVVAALKPGNKVLVNPLVPSDFTLDVFRAAWNEGHLDRYMLNSIVVAIIVTVAQVVTAVLSAYAFAILEWPGPQRRVRRCSWPRCSCRSRRRSSSTAAPSTRSAGSTRTRA